MVSFHIAPVQGHTDAAYRHFHQIVYGGKQVYYTPFIRLEKDSIRNRDLKDITSSLNENIHLVPQIIFRDESELSALISKIRDTGIREIDLNMGCPFPLQTGHGRGAATIANPELVKSVIKIINDNSDIVFSVKMRLGLSDPEEWKNLLPKLNEVTLKHITLHPRIAKQQYLGEVNMEQFEKFLSESVNPVIFNGDIKSPGELKRISEKYPKLSGIMAGRGILGRPSLFRETEQGKDWDKSIRLDKMLEFHRLLFNHYSEILCGETQLISKIQPFWEYTEEEIGRKAWKAIKKASNISKYQTAVAMIEV